MKTVCIKQGFVTLSFYLLFANLALQSFSQYIVNGSASKNTCNCYSLTQPAVTQSGSVWNSVKINLNNPFDFSFNVYLGCMDANGADGIVFILQPISTSLGTSGEGLGFDGISPSIGISLDTWQNTNLNDPVYDHISIQANGFVVHGADLAGPVPASAASNNIEDCAWHVFRISWDPDTKWLRTYFDGALRLELKKDIVISIFNNDPMVYWGFSAATGGAFNLQQFCTALNPQLTASPASGAACVSGQFTFRDQSVSFAPIQSWYWDFGDASTSTLQNPPPHVYSAPGIYEVKQVIRALDGCVSDTLKKTIAIGTKPAAALQAFDTCSGKSPRLLDLSSNAIGDISQWTWVLDDSMVFGTQQPLTTNLSTGLHQVKLVVKSVYGCGSDTAKGSFIIGTSPVVDIAASDGCINTPIKFKGLQPDSNAIITQWNWSFGDGNTSHQQNPVHLYASGGVMDIHLSAMANGCPSADVVKPIKVSYIDVAAMNDTIALFNMPFKIGNSFSSNTYGVPSFSWFPGSGLINPNVQVPTAILQDDINMVVTATIAEGCMDKDTVKIKVFKGSSVYVPTGFTPNGNGLNDKLRPVFTGVKHIDFFRVYNRWGRLVFVTNVAGEGWDGKLNGISQPAGTFVWMLRATDFIGKVYQLKGTSVMIR